MEDERGLLTSAAAAGHLGVRLETLYAYVSRGLLHSRRLPGRRGSWFDPEEVHALAEGRGTPARGGPRGPRGPHLSVSTALTRIDGGSLRYRGHDAVDLAARASFEAVTSLLWEGELRHRAFEAPSGTAAAVRQATGWLAPSARLADRLALIVPAAASADALRFDLSPSAVASAGRVLIAAMVDGLPARTPSEPPSADSAPGRPSADAGDGGGAASSLAARLWIRLAPGPPPQEAGGVLNGVMVLLADHELATSTLAARIAASTRANPYSAVAAALGALDGPLHGSASEDVHRLLCEAAEASGPTAAVADRLRRGRDVPGFGHPLYPAGDPRGRAALELVRRLGHDSGQRRRWRVVEAVLESVGARTPASPNSDFGLGALAFVAGMAPDAGEAIFAIARTAGWIAHVLEEYGEQPLRFRARGSYTGP